MLPLFAKVAILLTASLLTGALGSFVGRNIRSIGAFIGLAIAFIGGVFVVSATSGAAITVAIPVLLAWVFVSGLFIGPAIQAYADDLGEATVCGAFLGTALVMALCGAVGALSGIDFSGMGVFLGIALLGLIIFGIIAIFKRMSREVSMGQAIIGMIVFAGYFIFDFFRLSKSENTWQAAINLTMQLYLDFVNFLLYLLKFLAAAKSKDHSMVWPQLHDTMVAMVHHAQPLASAVAHHAQPALAFVGIC